MQTNVQVIDETEFELTLDSLIFPNEAEESCIVDEPHIIIFADKDTNRVFVMNMIRDKKPIKLRYDDLLVAIEQRNVLLGDYKPLAHMMIPDSFINDSQKKIRERKMNIIRPIIDEIEAFLDGSYGKKIVQDIVKTSTHKVNRTEIYKFLYRYWRTGSRANGFFRKPGSGKSKTKFYKNKTGPKNTIGRMRTRKDEKNIVKTLKRFYLVPNPMYLKDVYNKLNDWYYSEPVIDSITHEIVGFDPWCSDKRITEGQFMGYAREYLQKNKAKVTESQGLSNEYAKDAAALSGNIHDYYDKGPGYYYQIDETPLDIELVSELDPQRRMRMGKPTAYVVRDMSTRAFVGLYLTFRKSSAHTASNIVYIAFRNKQKFCDELGIQIDHEDWPMEGKCRNIMVDNAEFAADLERSLSKDAQITVHFNKEGNSQLKGLVERAFRLLHDCLKGKVSGYSPNNIPPHIKKVLRNKALLNINELYQILISYITIYNQYSLNEGIVLSKEMVKKDVVRTPQSVWNYGKKYRAGYLRSVNDDELAMQLLDVGKVTIYPDHVFLQGLGLQYKCDWTKANGYQSKKLKSRPQLNCRVMRHSPNYIFIETSEGLKPATLIKNSTIYENSPREVVEEDKSIIDEKEKKQQQLHDQKQGKTRALADNLQDRARKKQQPINVNQANTQDLGSNRDLSISEEDIKDAERYNASCERLYGSQTENTDSSEEATSSDESPESKRFIDMVKKRRNSRKKRSTD